MPTLGVMLLGDVCKDDTDSLQDLSDREVKDAPGYRTKSKRKRKSVTLGKGISLAPKGGKAYNKAAENARQKTNFAVKTDTSGAHMKAAAAHTEAAKESAKDGNFGLKREHEEQAAAHTASALRRPASRRVT
jgi:hypothetical protein